MAAFDWVIVAILVGSLIAAAAEGFFFELFSLGGSVLGFVLAAWNYGRLAPSFEPHVKSVAIANAAGFLVIFFTVMIVGSVAGKIARWAMKEAGLSWIDRALGAAFGLLRGLLVVSVMVLAIASFMPEAKWFQQSQLSGYFLLGARVGSWVVPGEVRQKFHEGLAVLTEHRMQDSRNRDKTK
jgi:membrane protein required for colicin V production